MSTVSAKPLKIVTTSKSRPEFASIMCAVGRNERGFDGNNKGPLLHFFAKTAYPSKRVDAFADFPWVPIPVVCY